MFLHTEVDNHIATNVVNFKNVKQHDTGRAKQLYERAVKHGHARAATELGVLLEHGANDVRRDVQQARRLYEEAAIQGDVFGLCNLAWTYERGNLDVRKDVERAVALYVHAARKGCERAARRLRELAPAEIDRLDDSSGDGEGRKEEGGAKMNSNESRSPTSVSTPTTGGNDRP